jgi:type I restriction enzyme, S subunit
MTSSSLLDQPVSHLPVPSNWNASRIGTFATKVGSGATPRGGKSVYLDSRVSHALIRSQHVFDRRFENTGLAFISKQHSDELRNAEVRSGDILLNITGDGVTFARACIVPDDILPACVNQHVSIIRVDQNICVPGYLLAFLTHPLTKRYIESFNTGGSRRAITKGHIQSFEVPLPPLLVQSRIAAILSAYDDLIENNQRRIKILDVMAHSLYREWFVHFRFPGHNKVKMVPSPLGPIPQGWKVKKLGEILELNYGKALKQEDRCAGSVAVFGSSGIVGFHDAAMVKGPGIIVGRKGNVGSVFWSDDDFYPIDTVYFVSSSVPLRFLFYDLQTKNFLNNDAAVPGLNRNQAYSLKTIIPPKEILARFCALTDEFEGTALVLRRQSDNLHRTRDLLIPRLLSGQISLSSLQSSS